MHGGTIRDGFVAEDVFDNSTCTCHLHLSPWAKKRPPGLVILFGLFFLVFILFPRIPLYNPILLARAGGIPYKIYGQSNYPTRAEARKFELAGERYFDFTVSAFEPVPGFQLDFENPGVRELEIEVANFDRRVERVRVLPGAVRRVVVKNLQYKRFKGSSFYRFHLRVGPSVPGRASLYFQLSPLNQ